MTESRKTEPENKDESDESADVLSGFADLTLESQQKDIAQLSENPQFKKMIIKHDNFPVPEELLYSNKVVKINRKGKEQQRVLAITNKAIYNLAANDFKKPKRRIDFDAMASVSISTSSNEFAIHIPSEYDYRFKSDDRSEIIKVLSSIYKKSQGVKLKVARKYQQSLINEVVTKDVARLQTREQRLLRYKVLISQPVDSDNEEAADFKNPFLQKIKSLNDKQKGKDNNNENDNDKYESIDLQHRNSGKKGLKCVPSDFEFLKVIGRGSFGKVMLVKKKDNGKLYAMKILKKKCIIARRQIEHTKAERRILESLQHPFCMTLRYAFQTTGKLYLVLDFYRGGELFFHLKKKRKFTEAEGQIIVAEVALALGHLHSFDIIYRDLKPENILMDLSGHVCLTDFGLSKELDVSEDNNAITHTFCGTPEYLAPEIVMHTGHDLKVDWWTLGVLAYELMVGIPPFYSQNVNEMYRKIQESPLLFPNNVSKGFKMVVSRLLIRDPLRRLGSRNDVEDVKAEQWFKNLDFDKLMKKEIEPVYKPQFDEKKMKKNPASNFDQQFTNEPVIDSYSGDAQLNFAEFSYQTKSEWTKSTHFKNRRFRKGFR